MVDTLDFARESIGRDLASANARWSGRSLRTDSEFDTVIREGSRIRELRSRQNANPRYLSQLAEAARLISRARTNRYDAFLLQEAMSTSDFPLLMGDILDRQLLANYQISQPNWMAYCKQDTVNDFRQKRLIGTDGARGRYQAFKKPELVDHQEKNNYAETGYLYSVDVFERGIALDWKMIINDELGGFNAIPDNLADGARRTESYMVTSLYATSSGPDSTFFSNTNKNLINTTNGAANTNPALSIDALQDAWTVLGRQVDADGEPIEITAVTLVVPPALDVISDNILHATELRVNATGGGTADQLVVTNNWIQNKLTKVMNPYLPIIDTTHGSTAWYLFANPTQNRPALVLGFLRGYQQPTIFMKSPNTMRVGGGVVDPMFGDFDTHEIQYKGMHILGAVQVDPKMAVASNGSGS